VKAGDEMELVVLPAPFGPINANVSFSCTVKLTSCTARAAETFC